MLTWLNIILIVLPIKHPRTRLHLVITLSEDQDVNYWLIKHLMDGNYQTIAFHLNRNTHHQFFLNLKPIFVNFFSGTLVHCMF